MVKFKSLSQIAKFANTPAGQLELLKMKSPEIEKLLIKASQELEGYLREGLQRYFDSYAPSGMYTRTGQTMRDIKLGLPIQTSPGVWSIGIEMNSPHNSLFGGEDGNTLSLLNTGWKAETLEDNIGEVEHFTRFKGTNYVQDAVNQFNNNNKYGMKVRVIFNGEDITGVRFNYGK